MPATTDTPRVWLACLACYNAGRLHGQWTDATDADAMAETAAGLTATCPEHGEEIVVHDYDGLPDALVRHLGETGDWNAVATLANTYAEHGEPFAAFVDDCASGQDMEQAVEDFQSAYLGTFDSPEDWAADWLGQSGDLATIPEHLRNYFDFAAYARDCRLGGDVTFSDLPAGGVAVFSNNY